MPEFSIAITPEPPFTGEELTAAFVGYATSVAWVASWDTATGDAPDGFSNENIEFSMEDRLKMWADLVNFIGSNYGDVIAYVTLLMERGRDLEDAWEQVGHDFNLTRNGHGAGFWDRGLDELGDRLTKASKPFGEQQALLWLEDDVMQVEVTG